jgi:hypothetical protein
MARIFTFRFTFNGQSYDAMATVTSDSTDRPLFAIRLLDPALEDLIPTGTIQYRGFDGYTTLVSYRENALVAQLLDTIAQSVKSEAGIKVPTPIK